MYGKKSMSPKGGSKRLGGGKSTGVKGADRVFPDAIVKRAS